MERRFCTWSETLLTRIVLVLLLLLALLCDTVSQKHSINCTPDADPLPHEFYQPGNLVIGAIVSQVLYLYETPSFKELPTQILIDELV